MEEKKEVKQRGMDEEGVNQEWRMDGREVGVDE